MVVDDQPEFLRFARVRLTSSSDRLAIVGEATSGQAALDLLKTISPTPDGVLLDVEMPGLDGFDVARRLRALAPSVRVILTSASDGPGYSTVARKFGATFLPKRNLSAEAVLDLLD
jgi:DNA-binding NarL/FixJ family response regulator